MLKYTGNRHAGLSGASTTNTEVQHAVVAYASLPRCAVARVRCTAGQDGEQAAGLELSHKEYFLMDPAKLAQL